MRVIEFDNVTKHYRGQCVVDRVSLQIAEGETLVLLGTSGSGKTTCLKMVNRLVDPTSGRIRVFGRDIGAQRPETLRRQIGYVIQNVGLFPHYTVAENVATVPVLLGWSSARIAERVDELLRMVGLSPAQYGKRKPHALSGGERQRVGLARALAADPPVVLLDEPFGALDPLTRRQMQLEFATLQRALGKTMILVTHDVEEAARLAHRICLLDHGTVQQVGAPRELLLSPANDFVRRFFDPVRLQLELSTLTLADLEPFLEEHSDASPRAGSVAATTELSTLLDDRSLTADAQFTFSVAPGCTPVTATVSSVLRAYHRYREQARTDG